MTREYRRTCRACRTVWHSLVSREQAVAVSGCADAGLMCNSISMCSSPGKDAAFAQHGRNMDANSAELARLQSCPRCGSSAYDQEIVEH